MTVPTGATALRIRGWRWIRTNEPTADPVAYDFLTFGLMDSGGTAVLEILGQYSDNNWTTGWTFFEFPAATPHAGETLRIVAEGLNDDGGGLCPPFDCFPTEYFLDTLAFEALVCL